MDYYDEWEHEERGYVHVSHMPDTELMGDKLEIIVKQLYSKTHLDKATLESALDDLCDLLGVKVNEGDLQIERKGTLPAYLKQWVEFNRETLQKAQ